MATIKLYLDNRIERKSGQYPLNIAINHNGSTSYIPLNISLTLDEWDKTTRRIINHPRRVQLNQFINQKRLEAEIALIQILTEVNKKRITATELRNRIAKILNPQIDEDPTNFEKWFLQFTGHKEGRTKEIYEATYRRLKTFLGDKLINLKFENINKEWLQQFDDFLSITSPSANARNIHLRNIRTVFNDAIDNEITNNYPFRKFKIRPTPTRKRNLSIDALRKIFNTNCLEPWQNKYRDFFKLSFMLIGINVVDLCALKEIEDGRIYYTRAKTHKLYSIKVEPEAQKLIQQYKGKKNLLSYMDTYTDYRSFYMNLCNGLKAIKKKLNEIDDGIIIREMSSYWARHSWATIAYHLDIPKETIAAALGHGGNTVTDIYIDIDYRKVDDANRKVLDYVLYDKKE